MCVRACVCKIYEMCLKSTNLYPRCYTNRILFFIYNFISLPPEEYYVVYHIISYVKY